MKPSSFNRLLAAVTTVFASITVVASAGIVLSGETNNDAGFTVSATDLLQTNLASTTNNISVNTFENNAIGGNAALLNNGSFGALGASGGICINGGSITYELTTTGPTGYNISEVNVYTGWNDDGRDGQNYTVSYSTVSDPGTFIDIATVTRDNAGRFEKSSVTEDTAPNLLATNVKAIRITFNSQENNGVGYKEIDVIGSSPVPTPRNLTWNNGASTGLWNNLTDANWTGSTWDNARPDNAFFTSTGGSITLDAITAGSVNVGNATINVPSTTFSSGSLNATSLTVQGFGNNGGNYPGNPTLSTNSSVTISGDASIGRANLEITGGSLTANRIISAQSSADWARLVVSGGTVTANNGVDGSVNTTATFAIDLNGGELRAPSIRVANREIGTNNNAWLTFNGGKVTAIGAANSNFITTYGGGSNTYVGAGGVWIDTNGLDTGIQVNLLNGGGGGGLTKDGAGTLSLTGALTYTGNTTVNGGVLSIGNGTATLPGLSNQSQLTIESGAKIDLNFSGTLEVGSLVLAGSSVSGGTFNATSHPLYFSGAGSLLVLAANDGTWASATDGNWSTAANWSANRVANGEDKTAFFSGAPGTGTTITLDSNRTIGNLAFSALDYTITGSSLLTLANTSSTATVSVGTGRTATIVAGLTGAVALEKTGTGTLSFTSTGMSGTPVNSYTGGTLITAGTIEIYGRAADNGGFPSIGTGPVTIGNGGTLVSQQDWTTGSDSPFSTGNVGTITIEQGGTWTINGSANAVRNGLVLNGGTINGTGTNLDWGGLYLRSTYVTATATSSISVDTALNGNTPITVDPASTLTYSGTIRDRVGNSSPGASRGGIIKDGEGTLVLSASNSYTGDTTVLQGTLVLGNGTNNSNLANGADVSVASGATLQLNFAAENPDTIDELTLGGVAQSPGTYNAANSGGFITGTGSLIVQNGPISDPFLAWIDATWPTLSDKTPTGDPDNDGIENLVEYVLQGGDPSASNPGILPTVNASGVNYLFTYNRRTAATGTTQTFQYSPDLGATPWNNLAIPGGAGVVVGDPFDGIEQVQITVPKGTNTKLFGRLKVTKP